MRLALATPLMAGLARIIYNPRPGEHAGKLRDPAELCDFADRPAVEAHLFDAFIPSAYRAPAGGRWTAAQAEVWLVFLARHLEHTIGSPDLAWWQLRQAVPRTAFRLVTGLVTGLAAGLAVGLTPGLKWGLTPGPKAGLVIGLVFGLVFGFASGLRGLAAAPAISQEQRVLGQCSFVIGRKRSC